MKNRLPLFLATMLLPMQSFAVVLVQTSDPGYYNNSIGTLLNLSNPGGDTCAQPFPTSNDCSTTFPTAPDLSAASGVLGNWLTNPANLNANWSGPIAIPNSWTAGTEVAVIYRFDTLGATNVVASFGVDNGIYIWLDGVYVFGARGPGNAVPAEYVQNLGDLTAGTHYLQLLLEDHGSASGYNVNITADTFIPCRTNCGPTTGLPEPATLGLLGLGLAGLGLGLRRRK